MNKFYLLFFLAFIGLTACKKSYTCTCTYYDGTNTVTEKYDVGKTSRDDAQTQCDAQVTKLSGLGATNISCSL